MLIETVTLAGFRCFGPVTITVEVAPDLTVVVGSNVAGKTALLHALAKLFGVSRAQRTVLKSDFISGLKMTLTIARRKNFSSTY